MNRRSESDLVIAHGTAAAGAGFPYKRRAVRLAVVLLVVVLVCACAAAAPTATARTALEQRLAQGPGTRPATPTRLATVAETAESAPEPRPTFTPFGRGRPPPTVPAPTAARRAEVTRVDSERDVVLRVDGRTETVAFIGVLPLAQTQVGHPVDCFGHEATALLRRIMPPGSPVQVEEDTAVDQRDPRGRLRLYVWLLDGTFVNHELLRLGFGEAARGDGRARVYAALKAVEREAAHEGLGLWSNLSCYDNPDTRGVP